MKVNVSVEATAQEMREFLGLPNVQPLHDELMKAVRSNMQRGVINFDALGMLKPLLPTQMYSMEMMQKFWEAVAKVGSAGNKTVATKDGEEPPHHEPSVEASNNGAAHPDSEKSE